MQIIKLPSPNYFKPGEMFDRAIEAVVLHGTASYNIQSSIDWLRSPKSGVSACYVISKAGVIYQLVSWELGYRAWCNGIVENYDKSIKWLDTAVKNKVNPNWKTISIEHQASEYEMETRAPMTDAQFNSSIDLTASILQKVGLKANHETIIGHNQISGTQKYNCPGVIFPPAYTEVLIKRYPQLGQ